MGVSSLSDNIIKVFGIDVFMKFSAHCPLLAVNGPKNRAYTLSVIKCGKRVFPLVYSKTFMISRMPVLACQYRFIGSMLHDMIDNRINYAGIFHG